MLPLVACNDSGDRVPLQITELDPSYAVAGSPGFDLTIIGTGFDEVTEAIWNQTAQPTRVISSHELIAHVSRADIAQPVTARIFVQQEAGMAFENDFRSLSVIFPVIPETIRVEPDRPELSVGQTLQFEASGILANGDSTNVSPLCDWDSSRGAVAIVDDSGLVHALAPGTTTITATYSDFPTLNMSTTLTVVGP